MGDARNRHRVVSYPPPPETPKASGVAQTLGDGLGLTTLGCGRTSAPPPLVASPGETCPCRCSEPPPAGQTQKNISHGPPEVRNGGRPASSMNRGSPTAIPMFGRARIRPGTGAQSSGSTFAQDEARQGFARDASGGHLRPQRAPPHRLATDMLRPVLRAAPGEAAERRR